MKKLIEPTGGDWTQGQFASLRGCGIAIYPSTMAEHEENNAPICVMAPGSSGNDHDMANAKVIAQAKKLQQIVANALGERSWLEDNIESVRETLEASRHYVEGNDDKNDQTAV